LPSFTVQSDAVPTMKPSANAPPPISLDQDICVHIFTVSSAMVGVCLTVIGLLRIVITIRKVDTVADDLVAANALVFLMSTFVSYWALRTRSTRRMHRLERLADLLFLLGLGFMTMICIFITYAMTVL
jgi:heme/copper-type cytochrome/quinol oxidase subunit 3